MLILEKIIQSENDTCTEDDEDSDYSKIIKKTRKKKLNEVDWDKLRQIN